MAEESPEQPESSPAPAVKKRRWLKIALIALPIVLIAAAWCSVAFRSTVNLSDPTAVATKFISDVSVNHPKGVYALLTKRYQQKVSYDDFTASLTTPYAERLEGRRPLIYDHAQSKDSTQQVVLFNFDGNDDPSLTKYCASVTVTKDSKQWHVSAYEIGEGNYAAGSATPTTSN